jgi:phage-related protein
VEDRNWRRIIWVGSSKRDINTFPEEAKDEAGTAPRTVQGGGHPPQAKVLRGFGSANLREIVCDVHTDTYRVIYTVEFARRIYVLHAFQKKSHQRRKTDRSDIELVKRRLGEARLIERELGAEE